MDGCYISPGFFSMDRAGAWVLGWARALARGPSPRNPLGKLESTSFHTYLMYTK